MVLITKGSQRIPGYMPKWVYTNTTEYFNYNFKTSQLSAFSSLKSPTFCTKSPISRVRENVHFNLYEKLFSFISQYIIKEIEKLGAWYYWVIYTVLFLRASLFILLVIAIIFSYTVYTLFIFLENIFGVPLHAIGLFPLNVTEECLVIRYAVTAVLEKYNPRLVLD